LVVIKYWDFRYPVTEIEKWVFKGGLTNEEVQRGLNWGTAGEAITSVVIPGTVKKIDWYAFAACPNLTTVILPDTLEEINQGVFRECPSLHTVNIPAGIKTIWNGAFSGCGELYNLSIPDSVTAIEWELGEWGN
jgi:hypothetical protein